MSRIIYETTATPPGGCEPVLVSVKIEYEWLRTDATPEGETTKKTTTEVRSLWAKDKSFVVELHAAR